MLSPRIRGPLWSGTAAACIPISPPSSDWEGEVLQKASARGHGPKQKAITEKGEMRGAKDRVHGPKRTRQVSLLGHRKGEPWDIHHPTGEIAESRKQGTPSDERGSRISQ